MTSHNGTKISIALELVKALAALLIFVIGALTLAGKKSCVVLKTGQKLASTKTAAARQKIRHLLALILIHARLHVPAPLFKAIQAVLSAPSNYSGLLVKRVRPTLAPPAAF